jgi:hypothetical protein
MNVSQSALKGSNGPRNVALRKFEANFTMGLREFFDTQKGKNVAIGIVAVGILAAIVSIWASLSPNETQAAVNEPPFINAKTGELRYIKLKVGMELPAGFYRAEYCYWTKEGKIKEKPTAVLLNKYKGKPEPTFCPDCGRLVVGLNPAPVAGHAPPPTEAEYKARHP